MGSKSRERSYSFDVLQWMEQNDVVLSDSLSSLHSDNNNNIKKKKNRRRKKKLNSENSVESQASAILESDEIVNFDYIDEVEYGGRGFSCSSVNGVVQFGGELRQRNVGFVNSGRSDEVSGSGIGVEENGGKEEIMGSKKREIVNERRLEGEVSLDWKKLMASDPRLMENCLIETSPIKHFMEDLHTGHSFRSTLTLGNEKERERVYDTIFRLPWRCELVIDVGFFVCLDSFLSVFTIMPVRMAMTLWQSFKKRQFDKPSAEELSDFGCLLVMACGVTLMQQIDISMIYHMIRGQGTIKLYVVYNVLEIFDRLFQNFVGDVMQTVFNSANGLAHSAPENTWNALPRFVSDEVLAIVSSIIHSFILLVQAITLSTCIVAHNNALFTLLLSNNFAEIKSNVFKRFSKDNVHSIVYSDSIERFHICAFLLFVLAQNLLEAEGPWFKNFLSNALYVYLCEVFVDIIKHSFVAKFNDIKPIAFSEFLEDLSNQTLNKLTDPGKRKLIFVPLAPACVVLRVLRPVYAAHLPYNPLPWRVFCMLLLATMTFVMLGILKIMVSMGLKHHASCINLLEKSMENKDKTTMENNDNKVVENKDKKTGEDDALPTSNPDLSTNNSNQVKTVKVSNLSKNTSKDELEEFISFSGEIQYIDMQKESETTQTAYVTFKNPKEAETAMLLSGATIASNSISVVLAENYKLPTDAVLKADSKSKTNDGSHGTTRKAEDMVSTMLAKGFILGKDALNKAKSLDEKHNLSSKASATVVSIDNKIGLTEKISVGAAVVNDKVKEIDGKFQVSEKTKSAYAVAEQKASDAGTAIMSNSLLATGASWVSNAFGKVANAVGGVSMMTKEKVEKAEEAKKEALQNEEKSMVGDFAKFQLDDSSVEDTPGGSVKATDQIKKVDQLKPTDQTNPVNAKDQTQQLNATEDQTKNTNATTQPSPVNATAQTKKVDHDKTTDQTKTVGSTDQTNKI
ncbi:hypothetical protein Leryth_002915 [Lithospermum erythrorhizon]|nr:hypothetical protein Leryth_002915 [Lithospermum erythrorhizon]